MRHTCRFIATIGALCCLSLPGLARADASSPTAGHVIHPYNPAPEDGDFRNSCASWCNVGHYLIDLELPSNEAIMSRMDGIDWSFAAGRGLPVDVM